MSETIICHNLRNSFKFDESYKDDIIKFVTSWWQQDVRELAYFKWINAGKPGGQDDNFWFEAERELEDIFKGRIQ